MEMKISDDKLAEVNGGSWMPKNEEIAACKAALDKVNGKTCKYCKQVYNKDAVLAKYHASWDTIGLYNNFIILGSKAVPCITCGYWRFIDSDFE